jgi:hypothetical protein
VKLEEQLKIVPVGFVGWHGRDARRAIAAHVHAWRRDALNAQRGARARRHGVVVASSAIALVASTAFGKRLHEAPGGGGGNILAGTATTASIARALHRLGLVGFARDLRSGVIGGGDVVVVVLAANESGRALAFYVLSCAVPSLVVRAS